MSKKFSTGMLQRILLTGASVGAITTGKANALDVYSLQVTNAQAVSTACNVSYEIQGHGIFNDGSSRDRYRIAIVDSTDTIVSMHSALPFIVTGMTQTVNSTATFTPPSQPSAPLRFGVFETDSGGAYGTLLATAPLTRSLFLNAGGGCTSFLDNIAPLADAGPDAGITGGSTVTLDGTGSSDGNSDPLSYAWTQSGGPSVTLSGATTSMPSFVAPAQVNHVQNLTFDLVVSDGITTSSADSVTLSIPAGPNTAPVANAGADQVVVAGSAGGLNGSSSSDFDSDPLSYNWAQLSGPTVTLSGANTATPTYVVPVKTAAQQQMVFQLIVNDGFVDSAPDTVTITIPANIGPAANAGPDQQVAGSSAVTLNAASSADGDGDTLNYAWSQTSGPSVTLSNPASASPTFTAPAKTNAQQTLSFQVSVDDGLASDSDAVDIVVAANVGPTANAGTSHQVGGGSQVTLDASGSADGDGDPLTYAWTQVSGPGVMLTGANTSAPAFSAPAYNATNQVMVFEVTVSDGLITSTAQVTITVPPNAPPVVDAGADQSVSGGTQVQMTAMATDLENDPMTYIWTQSAGPTVTLANATGLTALFTAPAKTNSPQVLTFDFVANDGSANSAPDSVDITVIANVGPTADAGTLSYVAGGAQGALDGSASVDGDGDPLTYAWTQLSGPTVTLAGGNTANPTFTAPARANSDQTLVFELEVSDGLATATAQVSVIIPANIGPVADAGSPQTVSGGSPVVLDASGSADGDGDPLTYAWSQVSGPTVVLNGAGTATPTFTAPARTATDQTLVFEVDVTDGTASATAQVSVLVPANVGPQADAGAAQTAAAGSQVTLDGTGSSDPEGDPLIYSWAQVSGPAVTLSGASTATPTFAAPTRSTSDQTLVFEMTVSDGIAAATAQVSILVPANIAPLADAGTAQTVAGGTQATLDGSASNDPEGDPLTYSWTQISGPSVVLTTPNSAVAGFTAPPKTGLDQNLAFQLVVDDGIASSVPAVTEILVPANIGATADAGVDQSVAGGALVLLDASGSSDGDGDALTYVWTQLSGPAVALTDGATATPSFTAPVSVSAQTLVFEVEVSDGIGTAAIDDVTVDVAANLAPAADAGADIGPVDGGLQVQLDGSGSFDPEGAPLTYVWTQTAGSPVTLNGADTVAPTFTAPLANGDQTLEFQLIVDDGAQQSPPDIVSVSVRAVGTITVVQRVASGQDRSFTFTSDINPLNTSLTTYNGVGQVSANGVIAGAHSVSLEDLAGEGYALTDISCNDTDSTVSIANRSIAVALSPGENLVCTFTSADTRSAASKAIRNFLASRNELVMANQPDMQRRLDRLNGIAPTGGAVNAFGFNLPGSSHVPVQLAFNDQGAHASLSLAGLRSNRPGEDHADDRLDVWLETEASHVRIDGRKGDFQIAYLGADWLISPNLLIGGLVQYDNLAWKGPLLAGEADGHGWMAGPYLTTRISEDLYADVRAAWGKSTNQVSPLGTWTDNFETDRALYVGSLTGEFSLDGSTHLRPTLSVRYMKESQLAYADRYNVRVNGQVVDQGDVSLAPRIYRDVPITTSWTLRPYAEAEAIVSFGVPKDLDFGNGTRGRFKVGADLTSENGVRASLGIFEDGTGADNYHSRGFDLSFSMAF